MSIIIVWHSSELLLPAGYVLLARAILLVSWALERLALHGKLFIKGLLAECVFIDTAFFFGLLGSKKSPEVWSITLQKFVISGSSLRTPVSLVVYKKLARLPSSTRSPQKGKSLFYLPWIQVFSLFIFLLIFFPQSSSSHHLCYTLISKVYR